MKERIKELCEQAKVYANESTKDFTGNEPVVWMDYYTEKFAQLIVRECAGLLEKEAKSSHDEETEAYNLLLKEANWMKQHFGVEK